MNIDDWLTDERAKEIIEKVHALVNQETDRNVRHEARRTICDTIRTTKEGLDLAFAVGTLSPTACIAREDSAKYKERYSSEDAKKAMGE